MISDKVDYADLHNVDLQLFRQINFFFLEHLVLKYFICLIPQQSLNVQWLLYIYRIFFYSIKKQHSVTLY